MKQPARHADVCRLTDQLWVGGELSAIDPDLAARQLNELTVRGIDAIIDTRIERDDIDWVTESMPQIDYLSIGVEDAGHLMPEEWFDTGTDYALEQIQDGHVVLIHCQAGINRGPSLAFAVLLAQGWDVTDALDHIRTQRPIVRIAYAEDAVAWWCERSNVPADVANQMMKQVGTWRRMRGIPHLRSKD